MHIEEGNIEDLLTAYLNNELDGERIHEVEKWIHSSKENQRVFIQTAQMWQASQSHTSNSFNSEKAWTKVESRIEKKPTFTLWYKLAAVAIMFVAAYVVFLNYNAKPTFHEITSINLPLADTLTDGSIITLNANSSLRYSSDFNENLREVDLVGEAYFNIKRDTSKKFIINIEDSRVTVLGTSFNINSTSSSNNVTVFVNSGTVLFEYRGSDRTSDFLSRKLYAGDKVSYNKFTHTLENSGSDDLNQLDLYWMDKNLVFEETSLDMVSAVLASVYKVDISFSDSTSKNCLLTASFKDADINEVIEVIGSTFEFQIEKDQNNYQFIGTGCEKM